jgi:hypothetical protein
MVKEVVDFLINMFQITFHNNRPHQTGHNLHTPITQNTTWVAYKALMTP